MSISKYKTLKVLGKGSYGAALLVQLQSNRHQKFVIKEVVIGHLSLDEQKAARSEADVLHQMTHSNIVSYIESFIAESKLFIVMEFADGGDLTQAINRRKKELNPNDRHWKEEEAMRIFVQICLALDHVHGQNILHRDVKPGNIFLTSKGMVKLGDFGIARILDATDAQAATQIGTPYYFSPEICESLPYGRSSDVWALGVVLFEILSLALPFQAPSLPALVVQVCAKEPDYSVIRAKYNAGVVDVLISILSKNPDGRPTVRKIISSDIVRSHASRLLSHTLRKGTGGLEHDSHAYWKDFEKVSGRVEPSIPTHTAPPSFFSSSSAAAATEPKGGVSALPASLLQQHKERLAKFRSDMAEIQKKGDSCNNISSSAIVVDGYGGGAKEIQRGGGKGRGESGCARMQRQMDQDSGGGGGGEGWAHNGRKKSIGQGQKLRHGQDLDQGEGQVICSRPMGEYRQQQLQQQQHQRLRDADVMKNEFLDNRERARQIKAKVEAAERGEELVADRDSGRVRGDRVRGIYDLTVNYQSASRPQQQRQYQQQYDDEDAATSLERVKRAREESRAKEEANARAALDAAHAANREERRRVAALQARVRQKDGGGVEMERIISPQCAQITISAGNDSPAIKRQESKEGRGMEEKRGRGWDSDKITPKSTSGRRGWGPPVYLRAAASSDDMPNASASADISAISGAADVVVVDVDGGGRVCASGEGDKTVVTTRTTTGDTSGYYSQHQQSGTEAVVMEDTSEDSVVARLRAKKLTQLQARENARHMLKQLKDQRNKQHQQGKLPIPRTKGDFDKGRWGQKAQSDATATASVMAGPALGVGAGSSSRKCSQVSNPGHIIPPSAAALLNDNGNDEGIRISSSSAFYNNKSEKTSHKLPQDPNETFSEFLPSDSVLFRAMIESSPEGKKDVGEGKDGIEEKEQETPEGIQELVDVTNSDVSAMFGDFVPTGSILFKGLVADTTPDYRERGSRVGTNTEKDRRDIGSIHGHGLEQEFGRVISSVRAVAVEKEMERDSKEDYDADDWLFHFDDDKEDDDDGEETEEGESVTLLQSVSNSKTKTMPHQTQQPYGSRREAGAARTPTGTVDAKDDGSIARLPLGLPLCDRGEEVEEDEDIITARSTTDRLSFITQRAQHSVGACGSVAMKNEISSMSATKYPDFPRRPTGLRAGAEPSPEKRIGAISRLGIVSGNADHDECGDIASLQCNLASLLLSLESNN